MGQEDWVLASEMKKGRGPLAWEGQVWPVIQKGTDSQAGLGSGGDLKTLGLVDFAISQT